MSAQDTGPQHYRKYKIQPWDIWEEYAHLDVFVLTVIAYLLRAEDKGGLSDYRKALHTLRRFVELRERKGPFTVGDIVPEARLYLEQRTYNLARDEWGDWAVGDSVPDTPEGMDELTKFITDWHSQPSMINSAAVEYRIRRR